MRLVVNGTNTGTACTVTGNVTTTTSVTSTYAVSEGDLVTVSAQTTGTGATTNRSVYWALK
jgi:uncharacterized cupin superfamily protein